MKPNRLLKIVNSINSQSILPLGLRQFALTSAFNIGIKYAGTTGISIKHWDANQTKVHLKNRLRIQNHIGGVHACAMATLAESATGMLFGLHVPDSRLPLLKSMTIHYVARAKGNLKAESTISKEQINKIQSTEKGDTLMEVRVTDEDGKEPIKAEMLWAWTTKKKKENKQAAE